jgi:hypothetical protein
MVKEVLVDAYRKDGEKLIKRLNDPAVGFKITTTLWYYLSEPEEWRLVIASPYVKENGPIKSYKLVNSMMDKINKKSRKKLAFSSREISVVNPDDPLINLLKGMVRHSTGISCSNCIINGFLVEGAYIYFID